MAILVSKELYDNGYRLDGEGRRVDLITPENQKYFEIFFFPEKVLMMSSEDFNWCKEITRIFLDHGEPRIEFL